MNETNETIKSCNNCHSAMYFDSDFQGFALCLKNYCRIGDFNLLLRKAINIYNLQVNNMYCM